MEFLVLYSPVIGLFLGTVLFICFDNYMYRRKWRKHFKEQYERDVKFFKENGWEPPEWEHYNKSGPK